MQYKWLVLTVTTIGVLMAGIDARIVIIGLPEVIQSIGADAEQGIWISQAYLLGTIAILLLVGRFADLYGTKRLYTSGFLIFTVGSALTSIAATPIQIILFRLVQGIGAGIILTSSVTIITNVTPKDQLGYALGINSLGFRFGAMAGLTISGIILSLIGDWRFLFYINIPVGVIGTIWSHLALKEDSLSRTGGEKKGLASIDWLGFVAFTISISTLLLTLTFAAYGVGSQMLSIGSLVISIISFVVFVIHERRISTPILDFKILRIRQYTGGVLSQFINAISWGAVLVLLSFYFQLVLGLSPLEAGLCIIPFDIAFFILGPLSGKLSDRYGHLPFTSAGIVLSSLSLFLFSTITATTPYFVTASYMVLFGIGNGMFSSPNMSAIMSACPREQRGIGSALRTTFFNVGFTISLNLAILVMSFTIPYAVITQITAGCTTALSADRELFLQALNTAYLWLAILNIFAIIPSALRGKTKNVCEIPPQSLKSS